MSRGRGAAAYQEVLPLYSRTELIRLKGERAARDGQGPHLCPYMRPTYRLAWLEGWAEVTYRQSVQRTAGHRPGIACRA
jgi:ribosome modulation factor